MCCYCDRNWILLFLCCCCDRLGYITLFLVLLRWQASSFGIHNFDPKSHFIKFWHIEMKCKAICKHPTHSLSWYKLQGLILNWQIHFNLTPIGFNIQALGECLFRSCKWYESMFPIWRRRD
jgi:hypothetical protein